MIQKACDVVLLMKLGATLWVVGVLFFQCFDNHLLAVIMGGEYAAVAIARLIERLKVGEVSRLDIGNVVF